MREVDLKSMKVASPAPPPRSLRRMRRFANGLLLAMTALFIGTHVWVPDGDLARRAWGYLQAFAEAAMVGGLADWFAVTAIFRHPLGLPIPHTAVIPRGQDRIADNVGRFIADNFLDAELVAERVKGKDLSQGVARWLSDPEQANSLAAGLTASLPGLLTALDDDDVADFFKKQAAAAASAAQLAPAAGSILEALAAQGRHQAMLDTALREGFRLLEQHEHIIREKVRDRSNWLLRFASIDRRAADAIIAGVEELLHDIALDPDHPFRQKVNETVEKFANDLRDDAELQKRIEGWLRDAISHPAVTSVFSGGWESLKAAIRRDCASETSQIREWLRYALVNIGEGLLREESVRQALNVRLRGLMVDVANRHGEDVARLVSETIRSWDARTIVEKLETSVGRDLQFIRVNGTVIGGLVGLALHAGAEILG
jgi:uncharacterized membrane-anchored protein YjiN (DUF445 family)